MEGLVDVADEVDNELERLSALRLGQRRVLEAVGVVRYGAGNASVVNAVTGVDERACLVGGVDVVELSRPERV